MNSGVIDKAFYEMIRKKGIYLVIGIERNYLYQLRCKVHKNIPISTDLKIRLLIRSGWSKDEAEFTRKDLVSLVKFALRQGASAKQFGAEYILEKWEKQKITNGKKII